MTKKILLILAILFSTLSYSQLTDANFQTAINTCLATNPDDGLCSNSEYGAMPDWDVSQVTDMSYAFTQIVNFNGDISDWDVSNVTNMFGMFSLTAAFNQDIGSWDVSNVTDMEVMFYQASAFNQDISSWCVANIDSEPTQFSDNAPLSESNKPVWGTCSAASVDDQNQLDISIYPNPSSDIVYIEGNYTQLKAVVYDIPGKQVINKSITNHIDISQLDKGVYILQLSHGGKLTTQRILKN
jgi:surface protein